MGIKKQIENTIDFQKKKNKAKGLIRIGMIREN